MNVLILYATVEGQTEKIASFAAEDLRKTGHTVELVDADDSLQISFEGIDAIVLAAPVHQRRHPRNFEALLDGFKGDLAKVKTLLVSVSLSAAFPDGLEEAQEYLTEMKMRTGFTPDKEVLVAGAVRVDHYDYFAMQVVRHVVLRNRDYNPDNGEHEFTDWEALSSALRTFVDGKKRNHGE